MKWISYVLMFVLITEIIFAQSESEIKELKILVREGDKALMDAIQSSNADCVAKVDKRYEEFVGGITKEFKYALFVERITLIIALFFTLLLFWGTKGLLNIYINRKHAKAFLSKMQNIENMINETYTLLKKKEIKKAIAKYKQIAKLYTRLNLKGREYIYQKILDLQSMVIQHGRI